MKTASKTVSAVREWPSYWFTQLEQSLNSGNFEAAAEASRELRRLGVVVTYPRPFLQAAPTAASAISAGTGQAAINPCLAPPVAQPLAVAEHLLPSRDSVERRILALSRGGPDVGPVGDAFDLARERVALKVLLNGDVSDRPAEAEKISPGVIARVTEGHR